MPYSITPVSVLRFRKNNKPRFHYADGRWWCRVWCAQKWSISYVEVIAPGKTIWHAILATAEVIDHHSLKNSYFGDHVRSLAVSRTI